MRLTKGMKKALSMFLTGALVVTGASIPATQTKAASAEKLTWEGTIKAVVLKQSLIGKLQQLQRTSQKARFVVKVILVLGLAAE